MQRGRLSVEGGGWGMRGGGGVTGSRRGARKAKDDE